MSKLQRIKEELAKLLIKYSVVKTDKAVLEYDGEDLVAGMDVYVTNEEGEKVPAEDGEYITEDSKTITVANGRVESIIDPVAEVDAVEEEPKEEEVVKEEPKEDEPVAEDEKDEKEEEKVSLEDVNTAIDELRKEVDELYKIVDSLLKKVGETRDEADERFKKLEKMSLAKPIAEEFEAISNQPKSTGNKKLDKFLNAIKK